MAEASHGPANTQAETDSKRSIPHEHLASIAQEHLASIAHEHRECMPTAYEHLASMPALAKARE